MFRKVGTRTALFLLALCLTGLGAWYAFRSRTADDNGVSGTGTDPAPAASLDQRFSAEVRPFLERYCVSCHGGKKPKGALDLSRYATVTAIANNPQHWELVLERLQSQEMPPETARRRPTADERTTVIAWIRDLREQEAERNAGDPGIVLARRLSNAEFDYTIRDLTGIDIRPTREFPVDPANEAGFDNSGESLAMSPALVKKYLTAARLVADHVVLKPEGFVFAPHPAVTDTDRDKYCVSRIMDFYARHRVDYADYFFAAWKYRHRAALGFPDSELNRFARDASLSPIYLSMIWSALTEGEADAGPLAAIRAMWNELPAPTEKKTDAARQGCEHLRDVVVLLRKVLKPEVKKLSVKGISPGSQPFVLWANRELAVRHRVYAGKVFADLPKLADQLIGADTRFARLFSTEDKSPERDKRLRWHLEQFCSVFPAAFAVTDRGPYFDPKAADKGRPLTAGFHLMQGYF